MLSRCVAADWEGFSASNSTVSANVCNMVFSHSFFSCPLLFYVGYFLGLDLNEENKVTSYSLRVRMHGNICNGDASSPKTHNIFIEVIQTDCSMVFFCIVFFSHFLLGQHNGARIITNVLYLQCLELAHHYSIPLHCPLTNFRYLFTCVSVSFPSQCCFEVKRKEKKRRKSYTSICVGIIMGGP